MAYFLGIEAEVWNIILTIIIVILTVLLVIETYVLIIRSRVEEQYFIPKLNNVSLGGGLQWQISILNCCEYPAHNMRITNILSEGKKSIPRNEWLNKVKPMTITNLEPTKEYPLVSFGSNDKAFLVNRYIEVVYDKQSGKQKKFYIKLLQTDYVSFIPKIRKPIRAYFA